jgi:hypothetical protein
MPFSPIMRAPGKGSREEFLNQNISKEKLGIMNWRLKNKYHKSLKFYLHPSEEI